MVKLLGQNFTVKFNLNTSFPSNTLKFQSDVSKFDFFLKRKPETENGNGKRKPETENGNRKRKPKTETENENQKRKPEPETRTGNGNRKRKPETETETGNGNRKYVDFCDL